MDAVNTTFPTGRRSEHGYNVREVEGFLEEARRQYDARSDAKVTMTSSTIRHTSFAMQRGGYSTSHVDAALERLEDAFALRERERTIADRGADVWFADARETAQEILGRLSRPEGDRFVRENRLVKGYSPAEVDRFAATLTGYFRDDRPVSVDAVRQVAFRTRRGGYREAQVDLLLDAVIDVMLAVR